jgi:hypothetical protein
VVVGGTQQFTATGYDQYGNVMGINPVWSTNSCGTIDTGGLFTAPIVVGQCIVTATDTAVSGTATVNVTDVVNIVDVPVVASSDDAEEAANGGMSLTSSDLEMTQESTQQTIGTRFIVDIPQGANILTAYIEFTVDETNSEATDLMIEGQIHDNAPTFSSASGDISSRTNRTAGVDWLNIPSWTTIGSRQMTPDISSIIQEIVDQPGLTDSIVIIITGTGKRVADSYNGSPSSAPVLHLEYNP